MKLHKKLIQSSVVCMMAGFMVITNVPVSPFAAQTAYAATPVFSQTVQFEDTNKFENNG